MVGGGKSRWGLRFGDWIWPPGKGPPPCEAKKINKNQFWGTSAHSFRQRSVTWFLGSGDTGGDVDADGDVNMAVDNTHGVRDWDKFGIRIRYGYC